MRALTPLHMLVCARSTWIYVSLRPNRARCDALKFNDEKSFPVWPLNSWYTKKNFIKLLFAVTYEKRKMEPGKIIFINSRERQFMHRSKRNYKHGWLLGFIKSMDARFLKFWYRSETIMQIRMKNLTKFQFLKSTSY